MNCSATSEHPTSCWPVLASGATHPPDLASPPPQSPTNQHSNQHQYPDPFLANLIVLGILSFPHLREGECFCPVPIIPEGFILPRVPSPVCLGHHWDPHQTRTFGPDKKFSLNYM